MIMMATFEKLFNNKDITSLDAVVGRSSSEDHLALAMLFPTHFHYPLDGILHN